MPNTYQCVNNFPLMFFFPQCSLYSNLSLCTEEISDCLLIPWPNSLVEQTFVDIHTAFFQDCPSEELRDPPPVIVFALVITPICLIPVMVSLVVLKTKNGDGSSWNSKHLWSQSARISYLWPTPSLASRPEDFSLRAHKTADVLLFNQWLCKRLNLSFFFHKSEELWDISHKENLLRKWHWFVVNVIICGITSIAIVQRHPPRCSERLTVMEKNPVKYCDKKFFFFWSHLTQDLNIYIHFAHTLQKTALDFYWKSQYSGSW